jgi:uncharacterized membrane protein
VLSARAEEFVASSGAAVPVAQQPEGAAKFGDDVTDGEIEAAFDRAEPVREQMVDADQVAQEAMRSVDLSEAEALPEVQDPVFQTHAMADLLERQGDADGASRIRAAIVPADAESISSADADRARRNQVISTLEGWLVKLRRQPR